MLATQSEASRSSTDDSAGASSGFSVPEFATQAEYDAWCESLPSEDVEVDARLLERVKTSIRLSRSVIDGYNHLAEKKGLRSGQTLMKIVLDNYLAKNLPEDF